MKPQMIVPVLAWFFVFIMLTFPVGAQVRQCVTMGKAESSDENIALAKKKAVDNALEIAVQSVVLSLIPPQVLSENLDRLFSQILKKKEDFLVSYKVLGEMNHGNVFLAGVESKIHLNLVKEELARAQILGKKQGQPRVLLLMAEQGADDILVKYWWGKYPGTYESLANSQIREEMGNGQFQVLPDEGNFPDPQKYGIEFLSIYDEQAAMALATSLEADLVILGKTRVSESSNRVQGDLIFDAVIDVAIYDPVREHVVLKESFQASARQEKNQKKGEQAVYNASLSASETIIEACQKFFAQDVKKEIRFQLTVEGESFLSRFLSFKQKIMTMPGILRLQILQMGARKAVVDMVYQGELQQFSDRLMANSFADFDVELADMTDNTMAVRFVEKQAVRK